MKQLQSSCLWSGYLTVVVLASLLPRAALAQNTACSIGIGSASVSLGTYNPFTSDVTIGVGRSFNLTFTRPGADVRDVELYFLGSAPSMPFEVRSAGLKVSYSQSEAPPADTMMLPPNSSTGTVFIAEAEWGGATTITKTFTANIADQSYFRAAAVGASNSFQIAYTCTGKGNTKNSTSVTQSTGPTFTYTVNSAVVASYAGAALDFGDISFVTDAIVGTATKPSGHINVASSGPFTVSIASANNWALTYPGGSLTTRSQRVRYQATLLGTTVAAPSSMAATSYAAQTCPGTGTAQRSLPLQVALIEGGRGNIVSANYQDTLTITITPLLTAASPRASCP